MSPAVKKGAKEVNFMPQRETAEKQFVMIGAGPAGLSAAYELAKLDLHPVVVEEYDKVGGLARTENYKGFHFDMGGHRFFTKVEGSEQNVAGGAKRKFPPPSPPVANIL